MYGIAELARHGGDGHSHLQRVLFALDERKARRSETAQAHQPRSAPGNLRRAPRPAPPIRLLAKVLPRYQTRAKRRDCTDCQQTRVNLPERSPATAKRTQSIWPLSRLSRLGLFSRLFISPEALRRRSPQHALGIHPNYVGPSLPDTDL